jgi:hypothetical protein
MNSRPAARRNRDKGGILRLLSKKLIVILLNPPVYQSKNDRAEDFETVVRASYRHLVTPPATG